MVRFIVLSLLLASCAVTSEDAPKMGQEVDPPYGWKYTYCPTHKDEIGCENFQHIKSVYLFQHLQLKQQLANAETCYTPTTGV